MNGPAINEREHYELGVEGEEVEGERGRPQVFVQSRAPSDRKHGVAFGGENTPLTLCLPAAASSN